MIFDICVNIFESVIDTFFLYSLSLKHKKNTVVFSILLTVIHFVFITAVNYISVSELFLSCIYIVLYTVYMMLITEKKAGEALFCACIPNVIYSVTCLSVLFTLSSILYGEIGYEPLMVEHKIPVIVFVHVLQVFLFWLTAKRIRKNTQTMGEVDYCIAAVSLILVSNLQTCFEGVIYSTELMPWYMLGGMYISILLIALLILLFHRMHMAQVKAMKQDFELLILKSQQESGEKILTAYNKLAEIRHDMKHFMELLSENEENKEVLTDIVKRYREEQSKEDLPIHSGNAVVDNVLNHRSKQADAQDISFRYKLNITHPIGLEAADLYLLMSNLLDNAILHIGSGRKIWVDMYDIEKMFMIRVVNSCDPQEHAGNNSRSDLPADDHGIGMITIRSLIEKYNGILEIEQTDDEYTVCILLNIQDEK